MIVKVFGASSIYALPKGNLSNRLAGQRLLADSLGEQGDAAFEQQVAAFVKAARQIGAEPVLCTFATSHTRSQFPNIPSTVGSFLFRYNLYLSLIGWLDTVERFNQVIRRMAATEHLRLVELDTVLSGREEYFRDFVHFTPEGHALVAQTIFSRLRQESAPGLRVATPNAGADGQRP
ncbi:MAG: SGNH/GDSL hydrolase family protein [Nitrospiraceae bacterium]